MKLGKQISEVKPRLANLARFFRVGLRIHRKLTLLLLGRHLHSNLQSLKELECTDTGHTELHSHVRDLYLL